MRDVLLGFLTYVLMIGAMIGTIMLCWYLFGPPQADRERSLAFVGGGGALLVAIVLLLAVAGIVFAKPQS